VPTTISAAVTSPAHTAASGSPAEQVAPTLLTLAKATDGSQQMTVRLHPADLGMVQVRIARAVSGATTNRYYRREPHDLGGAAADQPRLHKTLDEAGIRRADGRSPSIPLKWRKRLQQHRLGVAGGSCK